MYGDSALGSIIVLWIVGVFIVYVVARSRDVHPGFYVLTSILFSPIVGLIFVLVAKPDNRDTCWQCKEQVMRGALKCPHCGAELHWPTAEAAAPPPR